VTYLIKTQIKYLVIIVRYQHGTPCNWDAPSGSVGSKYNNSIICQFYRKVVLRLSEHGDVIETQPRVLYLYDMHTNMHTTQRLFPQRFLANSVPSAA